MSDKDKKEAKPAPGPRYYDADKNGPEFISLAKDANGEPIMMRNPDYKAFMGIRNGDYTEEEFAAQPEHIQRAIDASPIHRKTPLRPAASAPKAEAKQPEPAKE
jgi:hypothetical protein